MVSNFKSASFITGSLADIAWIYVKRLGVFLLVAGLNLVLLTILLAGDEAYESRTSLSAIGIGVLFLVVMYMFWSKATQIVRRLSAILRRYWIWWVPCIVILAVCASLMFFNTRTWLFLGGVRNLVENGIIVAMKTISSGLLGEQGLISQWQAFVVDKFGQSGLIASYTVVGALTWFLVARVISISILVLKYLLIPTIVLAFLASLILPVTFLQALPVFITASSLLLLYKE